ncbi:MAG: lactonase family protein [Bacteroidetes bacterium]|nr:lactonase family protein [Bacteroidota bacterium]MBS1648154.1 lactonase family protein [Bacteroidota bacterium]
MKRLLVVIGLLFSYHALAQPKECYMLVGTYTSDIHLYKFNFVLGTATPVSKISGLNNPSYLCVSSNGKYVYAVNEAAGSNGEVNAIAFNKTKGELKFINKVSSNGEAPCFVDIDSTGKWVSVANYSSGTLSIMKTNADGSLNESLQTIEHQGYGANVVRQSKPHVHCTIFSPDQKYLFSTDLGTDKIYQYPFNLTNEKPLNEENVTTTDIADGSGPRHITFHPNKKFVYLINELKGDVVAYSYNNEKLTELQTIESDNTKSKEDKGSADIHITPNGQYLYTTNRGKANDITIYGVQSDGKLRLIGHQSTNGIHPRNFAIDPTGKYLLVANRDSNNIVVFTIIKSTGFLEANGQVIHVEKPVCIKMTDLK